MSNIVKMNPQQTLCIEINFNSSPPSKDLFQNEIT